jgi:hypothetical protein
MSEWLENLWHETWLAFVLAVICALIVDLMQVSHRFRQLFKSHPQIDIADLEPPIRPPIPPPIEVPESQWENHVKPWPRVVRKLIELLLYILVFWSQ